MRKISKHERLPKSLNTKITNKRRNEIVQLGKFPDNKTISQFNAKTVKTYEKRFKLKDIKNELRKVYKGKCAYCEQKVEQFDIEHYRPKNKYYWLAYSWDNLLYCCTSCNQKKSNQFPVQTQATINDISISDIHNLRDKYDKKEKPIIINPEKEDIYSLLKFNKKGEIFSNDERVDKTIDICGLNREYNLLFNRKELYVDFEQKVTSRISEHQNGNKKAIIKLEGYIEDFCQNNKNPNTEFISFRKYIIEYLLPKLIDMYLVEN